MTQKSIESFIDESYSKPFKKNYVRNKNDVYHIDDIWSSDILDLKDYGPETFRNYRYLFVVIDNFSKFVGTTPLKKMLTQ